MQLRRLAPFAIPLACLALVGLTATGCADQAAAAKVGDQTLSDEDLMDEVKAFAANDELFDVGDVPEGSFPQEVVGSVLQQRIQFMIFAQIFDDQGLEITDSDRDAARNQILDRLRGADQMPEDLLDRLAEDVAKANKVSSLDPEQIQDDYVDLAESVHISSRYGSFDPEAFLGEAQAVFPPPGPVVPEGSGDDDALVIPGG